jgi:hypothetical protein
MAHTSGELHMCVLSNSTQYRFEDPESYGIIREDAEGYYELNLSRVGPATESEHNFTYMLKYSHLGSQQTLFDTYEANYGSPSIQPLIYISDLDDGNCEYALYYYSTTDNVCSMVTVVNNITIDNTPNPPTWNNFKNENTTNFTEYGTPPDFWTSIPNAFIYHPVHGSLNFSPYTLNFDSANLDEGLVFSDKALNFSHDSSYCLNFPAALTMNNVSFYQPSLERNGVDCISGGDCYYISYNETTEVYKASIPGFGNYEVVESAEPELEIWDDNDPKGGDLNKSINQTINFFANLTVLDEVLEGNNIFCNYSLRDENMQRIDSGNLTFNSTSDLYTFDYNFSIAGLYEWTVFCSADYLGLGNVTSTDTIPVELPPAMFSYWTDLDEKGGSQVKYAKQSVGFYAEYQDANTHEPINSTNSNCTLYLTNISQGRWVVDENSTSLLFDYSGNNRRYETNFTFQYPGRYPYEIICQDYPFHENVSGSGTAYIPNRLPVLIANLSNITIEQGRSTLLYSLNDYFIDPDGEVLNFSSSYNPYVDINISEDGSVIFRAGSIFSGNTTATFFAQDYTEIEVPSNEITITVLESEQKNDTSPSSANIEEETGFAQLCIERWECSEWSQCYPSGLMFRSCTDMNDCGTLLRKPKEQMECNYTGTCFDGIKNQGEEGVDCGGPCPPCPTCDDGIQNQGEEGIDCGGPCPPCPSCFDGIQNQGEEGIDCGGPCPPCGVLESPTMLRTPLNDYLTEITVVSSFFLAIIFILLNFWSEFKLLSRKFIGYLGRIIKSYTSGYVSIVDIEDYILKELEKLRQDITLKENKQLLGKLVNLYRFFLKYIFNLEFEFTLDEFKEFLKTSSVSSSKKAIFLAYLKTLQERVYGHEEITNDVIERLISHFKGILKSSRHLISKADLVHQEEEIINKINLFPWRRKFLNKKLRMEIQSHIYKHLSYLRDALEEKDEIQAAEEYEMARVLVYLLPHKHRKRFAQKLYDYKAKIEGLMRETLADEDAEDKKSDKKESNEAKQSKKKSNKKKKDKKQSKKEENKS